VTAPSRCRYLCLKPTGLDELPKIGAPATRALHNAGLTTLREVADVPRQELADLHGMGPKALRIIEEALAEHGLELM
jgi:predicted flap endonuclease-1-like 5' DNA nuclease